MQIIKFIKALKLNFEYSKLLRYAYSQDKILDKLSELFGVQFKIDWIGRVYAVINPFIKDGKYDTSEIIIDSENETMDDYVNHYLMTKLSIARSYIRAQNLFDLLTYKIKKLDNYDNYLFIMIPVTLPDVFYTGKKLLRNLFILGIVVIFAIFGFKFF